jgi:hypothetical protein
MLQPAANVQKNAYAGKHQGQTCACPCPSCLSEEPIQQPLAFALARAQDAALQILYGLHDSLNAEMPLIQAELLDMQIFTANRHHPQLGLQDDLLIIEALHMQDTFYLNLLPASDSDAMQGLLTCLVHACPSFRYAFW